MLNAFVLAKVKRDSINEAAQELLAINGVTEVYSVAGEWDLVVVVRVEKSEHIADLVTSHMLKVSGLLSTQTLIGFRAYSNYDLDRMFSLGFE